MSYIRIRQFFGGWLRVDCGGTVVRYGRFIERAEWSTLTPSSFVRIGEWSMTKIGIEREAVRLCLGWEEQSS